MACSTDPNTAFLKAALTVKYKYPCSGYRAYVFKQGRTRLMSKEHTIIAHDIVISFLKEILTLAGIICVLVYYNQPSLSVKWFLNLACSD
jgi:hypothetical protein